LSSSSKRDKEKMSKGSLTNEENEVKKNMREVSKWLRKECLKYGSGQNRYPSYLQVISLGLLLETKTKFEIPSATSQYTAFCTGRHFSPHFFLYLLAQYIPSPSPPLSSQNPFNLPPCYLAHSRLHCLIIFVI
jgi:hypothetical protein